MFINDIMPASSKFINIRKYFLRDAQIKAIRASPLPKLISILLQINISKQHVIVHKHKHLAAQTTQKIVNKNIGKAEASELNPEAHLM